MQSYHKKRLLKLADFLETLSPKKFDLSIYGEAVLKDGEVVYPSQKVEVSCGTTGCAIGYCPCVFRQAKYQPVELQDWYEDGEKIPIKVSFDGEEDFKGAKEFFGLGDMAKTYYLFYDECYREGHRGPKSVASRIRDFVERGPRNNKYYALALEEARLDSEYNDDSDDEYSDDQDW